MGRGGEVGREAGRDVKSQEMNSNLASFFNFFFQLRSIKGSLFMRL